METNKFGKSSMSTTYDYRQELMKTEDHLKPMSAESNSAFFEKLRAPLNFKHVWKVSEFIEKNHLTEGTFIVKGLISRSEFVLMSATAKTGKTFFALDLAKAVATGRPFLGIFPTVKGRVLYLETELSPYFLKQRLEGMFEGLSPSEIDDLYICKEAMKLDTETGKMDFSKMIIEIKPDLIIVDPFYRIHTKNEDKAQEVTPILSFLKEVAQQYQTSIFVLHHEGKKGESNGNQTSHRPRGSSAFADVPDVIISMTRDSEKKASRLSIEQRNFAPSKLLIRRNMSEFSWSWEVLESDIPSEEFGPYQVRDFLESGPKDKLSLIQELTSAFKVAPRTCERRVADAITLRLIKSETIAGRAVYSILEVSPNATSIDMADGETLSGGLNDLSK